ncbi:MAG: PilZ domain-containing protein [bacterium]|nr:PilZ domain-containing protein [bacterium]
MEFPKKREFRRSATLMPVEIHSESLGTVHGMAHDVSLAGVFVHGDKQLPVGTACRVSILLGDEKPAIRIQATGEVRRSDETGFGVGFDTVDAEGFDHLRNLVLANSEEPTDVIAEFESHTGLRDKN